MLTSASDHLGLVLQLLTMLMYGLAGVSCIDHFLGLNSTRLQVGAVHHLDVLRAISATLHTSKPIFSLLGLLKYGLAITRRHAAGGLHGPVLESVGSVGPTIMSG